MTNRNFPKDSEVLAGVTAFSAVGISAVNAVLSKDVGTLNPIVGTWLEETISFYDEIG